MSEEIKQPTRKFIGFTLAVEDKVVFAIILSLLGIAFSIFLTVFYQPNWVKENINSNAQLCSKINNEKLVLIGSGTVYEYLKEGDFFKKYYEIVDSSCLISVRVPSLTACKTLKDETRKNNEWIVMSSVRANPVDFMDLNEIDDFKKEKRIVEVFLEKDKLLVITTRDKIFDPYFNNKDKIKSDKLKDLLAESKNLKFDIYTTSEESGTYATYQKKVGYDVLKESNKFELNSIYPENVPFVILGSCLYKPKNFDYQNHNSYYVYDSEGNPIEKKLYLYFSCSFDINNSKLMVSKEIMKFLKCVKNDFEIPSIKNELILRDNSDE